MNARGPASERAQALPVLENRGALTVTQSTGVAVYGCAPDEAALFQKLASRHDVILSITEAPLTEANAGQVAGVRCVSVGHKTRVPESTLRLLAAAGVRLLSTRSAGCNHIDVDAARRLGIEVRGVAYSPGSVADHTLMLVLMALRNARSTLVRAEAQDFRLNERRGRELGDLTVGVIGTGRIGAAVLDRLRGFGCSVLAHDRTPKAMAEHVGLDELLESSDLVTLHAPLTRETRHLLDRERIARMRPGAIVVNTSRGALIDTAALLDALEAGRLGGAALDVVEGEEGIFYADRRDRPVEDERFSRLQALPTVLLTPHTAYYTDHALHDTVENTLLACVEFEGVRHA